MVKTMHYLNAKKHMLLSACSIIAFTALEVKVGDKSLRHILQILMNESKH